jgi:hypothetical protein
VAAAIAPDLDILFNSHRTYSHSIGATAIVGLSSWLLLRHRTPKPGRSALAIAAAYSTHLLLDWLGKDTSTPPGLMALWPLSSHYYLSGWNLFLEVSRRYWQPNEFITGNLRTALWELVLLGPVGGLAGFLWLRRRQK